MRGAGNALMPSYDRPADQCPDRREVSPWASPSLVGAGILDAEGLFSTAPAPTRSSCADARHAAVGNLRPRRAHGRRPVRRDDLHVLAPWRRRAVGSMPELRPRPSLKPSEDPTMSEPRPSPVLDGDPCADAHPLHRRGRPCRCRRRRPDRRGWTRRGPSRLPLPHSIRPSSIRPRSRRRKMVFPSRSRPPFSLMGRCPITAVPGHPNRPAMSRASARLSDTRGSMPALSGRACD